MAVNRPVRMDLLYIAIHETITIHIILVRVLQYIKIHRMYYVLYNYYKCFLLLMLLYFVKVYCHYCTILICNFYVYDYSHANKIKRGGSSAMPM